jgi:UPF0755 protein
MSKRSKKRIFPVLLAFLVLALAAYFIYKKVFGAKVEFTGKNYVYVYIGRNDDYNEVLETLEEADVIENVNAFDWLADQMDLEANIHPGRYRITNGMTMRAIINLIKYNKHEKVKLSFNSQIRTMEEFIAYASDKLEFEEDELENILKDEKLLHDYFNLDPDNCFALVIPGVYEVNWAISVEDFMVVLKEKYTKVWNAGRVALASKLGYSKAEVATLASIVQSESGIRSEQAKIAGVYINRLKRNMPLQADPTLKFANMNYSAFRILDKDKEIESPYNTYKYKGLPPGPICLVSTQALDATLNYNRHNYLYFCAKPDMKGYSAFSQSYAEHRKCAIAYRRALDRLGINR